MAVPPQHAKELGGEGLGGADSRWVSTLLSRRTLRKREELWRQGEREVGLRGRVEHLRRDV